MYICIHMCTHTHTHTCLCVCMSPAVESCADVATRNEGLWLNLELKRKRRREGGGGEREDGVTAAMLPLSVMKARVKRG